MEPYNRIAVIARNNFDVYTAKKIDWTALTLPEEYQYLPLP